MAQTVSTDHKFDDFTIITQSYKKVADHSITASILLPKNLEAGKHPLIVNLHGGFLLTGSATLAPIFPSWILPHAKNHAAIIVSANYRLLPTPNGAADVLADGEDFWVWLHESLPEVLAAHSPTHTADLDRIHVHGGSAGGYSGVSLALSHPDQIRSLSMYYPMVDLQSDFWRHGPGPAGRTVMNVPLEKILSAEQVRAQFDALKSTVRSEAGMEMFPLCFGMTQHGLLHEVFDPKGESLPAIYPMERLRAGARLPARVWVVHGDADSAVSFDGSKKFVELVKETEKRKEETGAPRTEIRFDVADGMDHGFDGNPANGWGPENEVVKAAAAWLAEAWLET